MPGKMRVVSQPDGVEGLVAKAEASPKNSDHRPEQPSISDAASPPKPGGRPWRRRVLFALLPLVLIGAGYWYVTGGQTVSMDDAYVESDKVGVSTDVAGIVRDVDVSENQLVETGQVLYRLDDLPFQLAVARADAQIGVVRDALNALKANYRDMQAQIDQAHNDVSYYDTEFQRQQGLLSAHVASQATFDTARRNLQNAQQKLASLAQQLAAIRS